VPVDQAASPVPRVRGSDLVQRGAVFDVRPASYPFQFGTWPSQFTGVSKPPCVNPKAEVRRGNGCPVRRGAQSGRSTYPASARLIDVAECRCPDLLSRHLTVGRPGAAMTLVLALESSRPCPRGPVARCPPIAHVGPRGHEDVEAETRVRLRSAVPAEAVWIARGVMSLVD
jgi:hypothetical protein